MPDTHLEKNSRDTRTREQVKVEAIYVSSSMVRPENQNLYLCNVIVVTPFLDITVRSQD